MLDGDLPREYAARLAKFKLRAVVQIGDERSVVHGTFLPLVGQKAERHIGDRHVVFAEGSIGVAGGIRTHRIETELNGVAVPVVGACVLQRLPIRVRAGNADVHIFLVPAEPELHRQLDNIRAHLIRGGLSCLDLHGRLAPFLFGDHTVEYRRGVEVQRFNGLVIFGGHRDNEGQSRQKHER